MTQIIHIHDYDSEYDRSMPTIEIGLSTPQTSHPIFLTALVDSGADATIIIGRDVLNHLEITLNGFAGVTEVRA